MWTQIAAMACKDIRLFFTRGQGLVQAVLLGLLLIFTFSLAGAGEQRIAGQWTAAIFWLSTCFCQVLIFNALYALEDEHKAREGLLMAPMPSQNIWVAKVLAGGSILVGVQAIFVPACIVFLDLTRLYSWSWLAGTVLVIDAGLIPLGALLGAMGTEQSGRDSLFTVILFPLLFPLLLAGIRLGGYALEGGGADPWAWLRLAMAFDAMFAGLALILFPFAYRG
ncbi:MAG: heme exporter protein CcmB [Desulfovermiculus sp.]|nr:heme exporter protein CcmB [Desulfovermiculus sp.]